MAGERAKPDAIRRYGALGSPLLPDLVVVAGPENSHLDSSRRIYRRWCILKSFQSVSNRDEFRAHWLNCKGSSDAFIISPLLDTWWQKFSTKWNLVGGPEGWFTEHIFGDHCIRHIMRGLIYIGFDGLRIAEYLCVKSSCTIGDTRDCPRPSHAMIGLML